MSEESDNTYSNKTIAKNAAALYFRMFITMLVGLYTSRVILQALGVEDYGIYNVVGGFVSMFSLISGSMQGSVSRFLTFELGTGNSEKLKRVFSTSFFVMIGLAILIVIATETIGIWYLNNKMVIPHERLYAAHWCFQLSVASFVLSLLSTPYLSTIISREKMDIYAYMSILDVVLKLAICYAVIVSPIDKLIFYAILLFLVQCMDQVIYWSYCKRKFEECTIHAIFEGQLFKEMFGFAGWNFIGSSAAVLRSQGANLLLNAFGGPIVNAANGIANTICGVVSNFVSNFTQAFNPQITKRYAAKEYDSLMQLLIYGSKYSFYLMFIITLPIILNTEFILKIWLGVVPEHTVLFTRWIFVFLLSESISRPIITAKNATGVIRNYQIVVGGVLLFMLPLSYLGLKLGMSVEVVPISNVVTAVLAILARMYMLRGDFPSWSSREYFNKVVLNVVEVASPSSVFPFIIFDRLEQGWTNLIVVSLVSFISCLLTMLYIGCDACERNIIFYRVKQGMTVLKSRIYK